VLPVKLVSFTARSEKNAVFINWQATYENDLAYYIVEKSSDGTNWNDLKTVMVATDVTNNYFVTDAEKNAPVVYYRLKEMNKNGQSVYSSVVQINISATITVSITNNTMVKDTINMQINATAEDNYNVEVFAINGAKIKQQQLAITAGYNSLVVTIPASAGNGLYVLSVKNNRGEIIYHSKLVKN
jgi:hypothetical protein